MAFQHSPLELPVGMLVDGRKTIRGSNIGARPIIKTMIQFAADYRIRPQIEEFPTNLLNAAIEKVRLGKMCYRTVLFQENQ